MDINAYLWIEKEKKNEIKKGNHQLKEQFKSRNRKNKCKKNNNNNKKTLLKIDDQ